MSAETGQFASLSRTRQARRERLLAAAERVFTRIGLRAATIEGIAEEAQVSKATLYAYFSDKMAVFVAVAERLAVEMRTSVSAALAGEGTLQDRIAAALMAKHGLAFDVVIGSPNAAELLETRNHLVRDIFVETDRTIEAAILDALRESGDAAPADTARLIFNASIGISEHACARDELETDLKRLVAAVLGG
jgi:AcrR family transcriptional regulator